MTTLLITVYNGNRFVGQDLIGMECVSATELRAFVNAAKTWEDMKQRFSAAAVARIEPLLHKDHHRVPVHFIIQQIFNPPAV